VATILGTNNADTLYGTDGADLIYGYGGDDRLYGRAGDDQIWGGLGSDRLFGEAGNDILRGEDGDDVLYGGDGNDILHGGAGNDQLYGDAGTDTLRGDAGNDILKGGTGIAFLYGGEGDDTLYYNPTTDDITKVQQYLTSSILDGDTGTDTLNIYNESKIIDAGATRSTVTQISMSGNNGDIYFYDPTTYQVSNVGQFQDMEKVTVTGGVRLEFIGSYYPGNGIDITGTSGADQFVSYSANDTMRGGAGNDLFFDAGGTNKIISETNDADQFYFGSDYADPSNTTITGFNGEGFLEGDKIYFDSGFAGQDTLSSYEKDGKTYFTVDSLSYGDVNVVVDKIGLVEGVDYFFS
jgi:Ca2+-binding RTX toxin-like protein